MKKYPKITQRWLKENGACANARNQFKKKFPKGVSIPKDMDKLRELIGECEYRGLDWVWVVRRLGLTVSVLLPVYHYNFNSGKVEMVINPKNDKAYAREYHYVNGQLHRDDGPAMIAGGTAYWCGHGDLLKTTPHKLIYMPD